MPSAVSPDETLATASLHPAAAVGSLKYGFPSTTSVSGMTPIHQIIIPGVDKAFRLKAKFDAIVYAGGGIFCAAFPIGVSVAYSSCHKKCLTGKMTLLSSVVAARSAAPRGTKDPASCDSQHRGSALANGRTFKRIPQQVRVAASPVADLPRVPRADRQF